MGEFIGIGDALIVTLFSVVMVFLVLIVISIFIGMLKGLDRKKEEPFLANESKLDLIKDKTIKEQEALNMANDEELVAVISAALAASMGLKLPEINIKSIRRLNNNSPAWARAGKQEQIYGKL